ncbi:MAG TPA: DUF4340 domain-containing protein [Candidatus Tectomicrobia bacterium]|jgi:hypothetical protein
MSSKRLLPLAVLLVILVFVAIILKRQPAPTSLSEETGFERLVPQTLHADRITGVELYQGAKPESPVRLRRQDGAWVVSSYYNAPVKTDKIKGFLDTLSTLQGELRADKSELLGDFRLEEAQAFHLRVYTEDTASPAVHLLAGKSSGRQSFMRLANNARVYSVNLNLYSEAGLSGGHTDQPPEAKPWLDLQVQDVPKDQITAVELHAPERSFRFAWQQPPAATTTQTPQEATTQEPTAKPHWALIAPEVPYAVKQEAVDSLVSTLRTLRAEDVADPARATDYGLDTPLYRTVMTVQPANQEAHEVLLLVGHAVSEQDNKRYARLGTAGLIYVLPSWALQRLFPSAKEVLELPHLSATPADITRLTWQQGQESWSLERYPPGPPAAGEVQSSTTWRLAESPQTTVDEQAVNALLDAVTQLTVDDWFEQPTQPTALDRPLLTLTLTLRDGRQEHLTVGSPRGNGSSGYYASLLDAPGIFAVSATTYTTLTEVLAKLRPSSSDSSTP